MKATAALAVFIFLLTGINAEAYVDPGTGGILVGTLLPIIVAFFSAIAVFFLRFFWKPLRRAFGRITGKDPKGGNPVDHS